MYAAGTHLSVSEPKRAPMSNESGAFPPLAALIPALIGVAIMVLVCVVSARVLYRLYVPTAEEAVRLRNARVLATLDETWPESPD
tara:strand:- start:2315 stop:2569 length:255 start_codon:yes stop_codon:yes gene_type:complete